MVKRRTLPLFSILIICLGVFATAATASKKADNQTLKAVADLSLPFIENKGQIADPDVAYVADTFACRVSVTRNGHMIYSLPEHKTGDPEVTITEELVGATVDIRGKDKQATKVSYFPGRDPSGWHSNLPCYARVGVGSVAKGIRMELKAHSRIVEKLFYVEPGADPSDIRIAVKGVDHLKVGPDGELGLATSAGAMRFTKPVAYQQINGARRMVPVRYKVNSDTYGFEVGAYDVSRELVIDPLLTVFPVSTSDTHNLLMDLAKDSDGNIYAAGVANSKLSVLKIDSRLEKLLAAIYFSENARYFVDIIRCLALDRDGNVFVAGTTWNPDFPVTPGCYDSILHNDEESFSIDWEEGFVTKLSPDLDEIQACTFIGGYSSDEIFAMVLDTGGRVYVAGYSERSSVMDDQPFPVDDVGGYDTIEPPQNRKKAVVARLDSSLTKVQAVTFLGGSEFSGGLGQNEDIAYCLSLDGEGNVWVAGRTHQPDFPVTQGSLDQTHNGGGDVFLSKLDADLKNLLVSTYIGGNQIEAPTDMLFDNQGNIYLLGWTFSHDFPMAASGYKTSHSQEEDDGFVLKLNADASKILGGTFIGGTYDGSGYGDDVPSAMALSADNSVLRVVGRTESENFPTTPNCFDSIIDDDGTPFGPAGLIERHDHANGDQESIDSGDGFYTVFNGNLTNLVYSTFIGGKKCEYLDAILINGDDIIVAGETSSLDFPGITTNDVDQFSRGVLLRFKDETNDTPGGSDNNSVGSSSGGGGGGGCFIQVTRR